MVKVQQFGNQFRITIPQDIIKVMDWDRSTEIIFLVESSLGSIIIKELPKKRKNGKKQA